MEGGANVPVHLLYAWDPYQAGETVGVDEGTAAMLFARGLAEPYVEGVTPTPAEMQVPAREPPEMVAVQFHRAPSPYQSGETAGVTVDQAAVMVAAGDAEYFDPANAPIVDDPPEDPAHFARRTELGMTDVEFDAYLASGGT